MFCFLIKIQNDVFYFKIFCNFNSNNHLKAIYTLSQSNKNIEDILPGLSDLWSVTQGDPAIKIAVIDGPIDTTHPALNSANLEIQETHLGNKISITGDAAKHGTHVASIIFGQHNSKIKGIAPNCTGLILPVFKDNNEGGIQPCSQVDLARTILQAAALDANVINISGGEFSDSGEADTILSRAIEYCTKQNILIVAAAGNDGCSCLHVPGAAPSVLAVGAMDNEGKPLDFSNWGERYQTQGILAPGKNIPGATLSGQVESRTGTSYATPIVSGIAALLLSIQKKDGIAPSGTVIREMLLESALGCNEPKDLECQRLLKGIINLIGVVTKVKAKNKIPMSEEHNKPKVVQTSSPAENVSEHGVEDAGYDEFAQIGEEGFNDVSVLFEKGTMPSDCSCKGGENCTCGSNKITSNAPQMVFALGTLGYDLGSEAAKDSLAQHMVDGNPNDPAQLLKYLDKNPWEAASLTWTLNLDNTPIYAIRPIGAFAAQGYSVLREFLLNKLEEGADRISVPGYLAGRTRLRSGQIVPIILPELRCMYNWNTSALVEDVLGKLPAANAKKADKQEYDARKTAITNFLERVYHELRNFGNTPQDRALNYAATNALNTAQIFSDALKDNMQLDTIEVERSAICREGSNCWDVILCFFDPEKQLVRARKCCRFTVDVSHVCPVMVGAVRCWSVR